MSLSSDFDKAWVFYVKLSIDFASEQVYQQMMDAWNSEGIQAPPFNNDDILHMFNMTEE